jgi:hypothetical protein
MGHVLKVDKNEEELKSYQDEFLKNNPTFYKPDSNIQNFIEIY